MCVSVRVEGAPKAICMFEYSISTYKASTRSPNPKRSPASSIDPSHIPNSSFFGSHTRLLRVALILSLLHANTILTLTLTLTLTLLLCR